MNFDPDLAKARIVLCRLACRREPFTSDDMREMAEREHILIKPQSYGAAIAEAKVAGYVKQTGEVPSRRPENHRRKIDILVLANEGRAVSVSGSTPSIDASVPVEPSISQEQTELVTSVGSALNETGA